jgi:hypothetical protein
VVCGWMERMDREIGAIGTCMRWKDMVGGGIARFS